MQLRGLWFMQRSAAITVELLHAGRPSLNELQEDVGRVIVVDVHEQLAQLFCAGAGPGFGTLALLVQVFMGAPQ